MTPTHAGDGPDAEPRPAGADHAGASAGHSLVVGIGCRRGASAEQLGEHLRAVLAAHRLPLGRVGALTSVETKAHEPGLRALATELGLPLRLYPAAVLDAQVVPNPSGVASDAVGTSSVAEASVLADGAELVVPKQAGVMSTVAVGVRIAPVGAGETPSAQAASTADERPASGPAAIPVPTVAPREALPFVPYPVGLRLQGRRVLVVGGGAVARRRVEGLLAAEADVQVVAPEAVPSIAEHARAGRLHWEQREFRTDDADGAWYAVACTNDPAVNAAVADAAEERRIFCVRSDDGRLASAWTPAVGRVDDLTVAVLANRQPYRSRAVRDQVVRELREGRIAGE